MGGSNLRIIGPFAPFDIAFVIAFLFSVVQSGFRFDINFLLFCLLPILGLALIPFNNVAHTFLITELRFYLYLPMVYYVSRYFIVNYDSFFDHEFVKIMLVNMSFLLLLYLNLNEGNFVYNFFNDVSNVDPLELSAREGRTMGLTPIFLSFMMMMYVHSKQTLNNKVLLLYTLLIFVSFAKSGSRQLFVCAMLPMLVYIIKRKNIYLFLMMALGVLITPLFLSTGNVERMANIANPTNDSSFMFRVINVANMLSTMYVDGTLLRGYGIGSNYDFFHLGQMYYSFYLDNSFVTMIYKVGIVIALAFWLLVYNYSKGLGKFTRLSFASMLIIPGAISYALVLDPAYLLGYFVACNVLSLENQNKEEALLSIPLNN